MNTAPAPISPSARAQRQAEVVQAGVRNLAVSEAAAEYGKMLVRGGRLAFAELERF